MARLTKTLFYSLEFQPFASGQVNALGCLLLFYCLMLCFIALFYVVLCCFVS